MDSTNSPIEYYIEGITYNIIDNSGLLCHYMFNYQDISGQTAANYASGSIVYDASLSVTGLGYQADYVLGNGCLNLIATSSQYVQVINSTITTTAWPPAGGLSFACWVNPNISGNPQLARIFEFGNTSSSDSIVMAFTSTGAIQVSVFNLTSFVYNTIYPININTDSWTHLVWVINPTTYSFYVNGVLYQTLTGTQYPNAIARTYCYIGKSLGSDPYYNGLIDDFRVYQRAITGTEAFKLYSFNSLSNYYKFDSEDIFKGDGVSIANYASGYPIFDASLSAVNTQLNGISTTSSMVGNACMRLSGNIINIPIPNISTNGFTVAFWMNTTSTAQNYPTLFFLNGNTTYNVYIYITNSGGTAYSIGYECRYNGTTTRTVLYTNIAVNDGAWHYIVVTSTYAALASATSTIRIYIDNMLNSSTTAGYYPNNAGLISGSTIGGGTPSYNGLIDDYRIYSRVLSSQEITALYQYTYSPNELAINAIGATTFTVTTPTFTGISATVTVSPTVTHVDSSTNGIYKTVLSGLSQNVGYGYTFTYVNGLVLTGNTMLYSTPATPVLTITATTTSITINTQSYSGIPTTGCYFYINGTIVQGSYTSNIYTATITGLSVNQSYTLVTNVFNNNSISKTTSTVYTIPNTPNDILITPNYFSATVAITPATILGSLPLTYNLVCNALNVTGSSITSLTSLTKGTTYSYTLTCYNNASYPSNSLTGTFTTSNFTYTNAKTYTNTSILFENTGSFTVTPGTTSAGVTLSPLIVSYEFCGGGSSGGAARNNGTVANAGGGGGAAQYVRYNTVSIAGLYNLTLGNGGAATAGGNTTQVTDGIVGTTTTISGGNTGYTISNSSTIVAQQRARGGGYSGYANSGGAGGGSIGPPPASTSYVSGANGQAPLNIPGTYGGCGGSGTNGFGKQSIDNKGSSGGLGVAAANTLIGINVCYGGGGGGVSFAISGNTAGNGGKGLGNNTLGGTSFSGGCGGGSDTNSTSSLNGAPGVTYGSGGGGGGCDTSTSGNSGGGGAGADGYFYMTYTLT